MISKNSKDQIFILGNATMTCEVMRDDDCCWVWVEITNDKGVKEIVSDWTYRFPTKAEAQDKLGRFNVKHKLMYLDGIERDGYIACVYADGESVPNPYLCMVMAQVWADGFDQALNDFAFCG